jgi:hypothetical protein
LSDDAKKILSYFDPGSPRNVLPDPTSSTPASSIFPLGQNPSVQDHYQATAQFRAFLPSTDVSSWLSVAACNDLLRTVSQVILLELSTQTPLPAMPVSEYWRSRNEISKVLANLQPGQFPTYSLPYLASLLTHPLVKPMYSSALLRQALDFCQGTGAAVTPGMVSQVVAKIYNVPGLLAEYTCSPGPDPKVLYDDSPNAWHATANLAINYSDPQGVPDYSGTSNQAWLTTVTYPEALVQRLSIEDEFSVSFLAKPVVSPDQVQVMDIIAGIDEDLSQYPLGTSFTQVGVDAYSQQLYLVFSLISEELRAGEIWVRFKFTVNFYGDVSGVPLQDWWPVIITNLNGEVNMYIYGQDIHSFYPPWPDPISEFYINGLPSKGLPCQETFGQLTVDDSPLDPTKDIPSSGTISLIRFYDHALSESEAAADYASMKFLAQSRGIVLP